MDFMPVTPVHSTIVGDSTEGTTTGGSQQRVHPDDYVETLEVDGVRACDVCFFLPYTQSCLLASPMAHAVLEATRQHSEALWKADPSLDLDFVLFDSLVDPASDRSGRQVYYGFLHQSTPPSRKTGETILERMAVLKKWIESCYKKAYGTGGVNHTAMSSPKNTALMREAKIGNHFNLNRDISRSGEDTVSVTPHPTAPITGPSPVQNSTGSLTNLVSSSESLPREVLVTTKATPPPAPSLNGSTRRYATEVESWLHTHAPILASQYDAYVATATAISSRRPPRVTDAKDTSVEKSNSIGNGGSRCFLFSFPLFTSTEATLVDTLTSLASEYARLTNCPFSLSLHAVVSCHFEAQVTARVTPKGSEKEAKESITILSECLSTEISDSTTHRSQGSYVPFLHACIKQASLPRLANSPEQKRNFLHFIPQLETALFRNTREPLHFLRLVTALASYWGPPIEVSPCCSPLEGGGSSSTPNRGKEALVKTASYCVVDCETDYSFMVNVHYYNGSEYPSVGIVSNQFLSPQGNGILQTKLRSTKVLNNEKDFDKDGFITVKTLADVMGKASYDSMSSLIAQLN